MSIAIEETVKRQCCQPQDRKPCFGFGFNIRAKPVFCVHCGQIWTKTWYKNDGVESYFDYEKFVPGMGSE